MVVDMTIEEISEAAKIYKKDNVHPLTEYQKKINEAATNICLKNPSMLACRARLLDTCRDVVNSDNKFKKGKSWSKRYVQSSEDPVPKRRKITREIRESRLNDLETKKKLLNQKVLYKEKRREMAENIKNYKLCEEITEEIEVIQKDISVIEAEVLELRKKGKKADWYIRKKWQISISSSEAASTRGSVTPYDDDTCTDVDSDNHDIGSSYY
jgi:predicted ribosome quality control (RQC) complex YloA/Tae2 family protein